MKKIRKIKKTTAVISAAALFAAMTLMRQYRSAQKR